MFANVRSDGEVFRWKGPPSDLVMAGLDDEVIGTSWHLNSYISIKIRAVRA
jgi:hypothetical protein